MTETIVAQASAPGKSGVAVVRLSGAAAFGLVKAMTGDLPAPRRAALRTIRNEDGAVIDRGLILLFPGPGSFTGEDVAEFQMHGSVAVMRALMDCALRWPGIRLAEPGEFTRRALENNRLDLAEVEALSDLIEAETEEQRISAQHVLSGRMGARVDNWRALLIEAAAYLEATIDFADEEVPEDVTDSVRDRLGRVRAEIVHEIGGSIARERLRDGFEVAIVGRPNAGKSTLLNALAGREAALTSSIAGTTRDVVEVRMDIGGLPVTLLDTAGLRDAADEVERLGVDRARQRADRADLRVWLASTPEDAPEIPVQPGDIAVLGRADLTGGLGVSGLTGEGIPDLLDRIGVELRGRLVPDVTANRERHRVALAKARDAIDEALGGLDAMDAPEVTAFHLRNAIGALEMLIGRVGVEDMLDDVFSRFCLGK